MAYDPNQAGLFNKLIQSGLNTANAALQSGISSTKDFALGINGKLGGLIPGANAIPATAQTVFQSVRFAETASGQPIQLAALATNAAPLDVPQTIVIPPAPVTGLDLTATSPTTFSPTDPRVSSSIPNPVIVTTSDAARDAAISASRPGYDQAPPVLAAAAPAPAFAPVDAPLPVGIPEQTEQEAQTEAAFVASRQALPVGIPEQTEQEAQTEAAFVASRQALPVGIPEQTPEEARNEAALVAASAPAPVEVAGDRTADGQSQFLDPEQRGANQEAAAKANTIQQAAIQSTFKQPGNGDWRFRISLAEGANYLYGIVNNSSKGAYLGDTNLGPGILAPLANTGGVIFPYTPSVTSSYQAKYSTYDLVHSNYRGAFYQNSYVSDIQIRGVFTAQDTKEAAYMLAVIHFFRSVTKMFYGQDAQRGAPPPLVFLTGLGDFQYNKHPAVVTSFDYTLPSDVDYIRADNPNNFGTDLLNRRTPTQSTPSGPLGAALNRLGLSGLFPGATPSKPPPVPITNSVTNTARATYVPTKIEISLTLMPMQTRDQVSKLFSLKDFANGNLIRGGFW
jgi:hypothetical protein